MERPHRVPTCKVVRNFHAVGYYIRFYRRLLESNTTVLKMRLKRCLSKVESKKNKSNSNVFHIWISVTNLRALSTTSMRTIFLIKIEVFCFNYCVFFLNQTEPTLCTLPTCSAFPPDLPSGALALTKRQDTYPIYL